MKDDRLRITVDAPYSEALGCAVFAFAILEWSAAWCCERLDSGYLGRLGKKTAGDIAKDLVFRVSKITDPALRIACLQPAVQFKQLVEVRNGILHGKPGSTPRLEQRLFHDGKPWTPERVNHSADEFTACGLLLNALLHGALK